MSKKIQISAVLPVHNEEENIDELHQRLTNTLEQMGRSFEIIYVENRSSDNSVEKLKQLKNAKVIVMRLPMYGNRTTQSIALDAGIKAATGELIVTLDSDLQNPPEEIPKLVEHLESENLDVVSGWRRKRRDNVIIRSVSKIGSIMRKQLLNPGVHDLGCTLKVYRRECFDGVHLYGEMHRYLVAILRWRGFRIGEVVVKHNERKYGSSSYNWRKIFRGFVDMWQVWFWQKYADRPLHLFGVSGIFLTFGGLGMFIAIGILRALRLISLADSVFPLISVLMIITGVQLFVFGMIIDLIIKNNYENSGKPGYLIKEVVDV